jgi:hypothetical protein
VSAKALQGGVGLPPGAMTFTLAYKGSTNGHTFNFYNSSLVVEPV